MKDHIFLNITGIELRCGDLLQIYNKYIVLNKI